MIKVYGSSSAFSKGKLVFTSYPSGCLRSILAKSWGYREPELDAKYSSLGARNEQRYEDRLKAEGKAYLRESPVTQALDDSGNCVFSGRRDFVIDPGTRNEIIELKATSSKSKLQMIKEGRYSYENLAQLVAYMVEATSSVGRLIYSFYKGPTDEIPSLERDYLVTIDPSGDILADGGHSGFTVADYLLHREQSIAVQQAPVDAPLPDRPYNYAAAFGSPCQYCPFKRACDAYDNGQSQFKPAVESLEGLVKR